MILSMLVILTSSTAFAMSSSKARQESWFLTDKMAYELYLTENQIQDVYEINYDYFRALGSVTGMYSRELLDRRNDNLGYVLTGWQWNRFQQIDDFVNPVKILNNAWSVRIYDRYTRGINYYNKPKGYSTYGGAHKDNGGYYQQRQSMHQQEVNKRQGNTNLDRKYTTPSYVNRNTKENKERMKENNNRSQDQQSQAQPQQQQKREDMNNNQKVQPQQNNSRSNVNVNQGQGQGQNRTNQNNAQNQGRSNSNQSRSNDNSRNANNNRVR